MAEAFNLDAKTGGFDIAGKPANFSAIILKFPVRAQMAAAPYHFIVPQSVGAAAATRGRMRRRKHLNKLQLQWINPPLDKPWVRLFIDVLELKAWRNLSVNARRIHDALTCWYFRNHQQENGQIKISYRQFERSGVARNSIAGAIRELNDAGFIAIKHGEPSKDVMTPPSLYRLCVYDKAESDGLQKTASRLFAFMPIDVIESPLWCGLSINARRILEHLLIMNIGLWSEQNGKLRVSVREFAKHGVGRRFTAGAVKELINAGLLAVTKGKARGSQRPPNFYRLTFLGTIDNPATWKPVESDAAEPSKPAGRKTEPMPIQKIFTAPQRCAGTAPERCTGESHSPRLKGDPVDMVLPPPKGDPFIISCSPMAQAAQPDPQTNPDPETSDPAPLFAGGRNFANFANCQAQRKRRGECKRPRRRSSPRRPA